MSPTRSRVLVVTAALTFFLSGCGSDSGSDSEAESGSSDNQASASGGAAGSPEAEEFRKCLAANGVDVPAEGSSQLPDPGSIDQEAMTEAMSECSSLAPSDLPAGPGGVDQSAIDAFVSCLADRGITVEADLAAIQALDQSKPQVRRAFEKCQGLIAPPGR
ncbi:MAG: hypothetical protein ACRCYU_20405 [Nocardioides sp.]